MEEDITEEENAGMLGEGGAKARDDAEESILRKLVVVQFLKGKAGQVLHTTQDQHTIYENVISVENMTPYQPFVSKLDQEFAKWAKLREPGSTAVSELLGIEGMSLICLIGKIVLTIHSPVNKSS